MCYKDLVVSPSDLNVFDKIELIQTCFFKYFDHKYRHIAKGFSRDSDPCFSWSVPGNSKETLFIKLKVVMFTFLIVHLPYSPHFPFTFFTIGASFIKNAGQKQDESISSFFYTNTYVNETESKSSCLQTPCLPN